MSKYIPYSALIQEQIQQEKRRAYGLLIGEYIKYPDAEAGPFIVKKSRLESLTEEQQTKIAEEGQKMLNNSKAKP